MTPKFATKTIDEKYDRLPEETDVFAGARDFSCQRTAESILFCVETHILIAQLVV